jgi:glycosyltransferase involved in cell wall biosynthesis
LASRSNPELQFVAIGPTNDLTAALERSVRDKWPPVSLLFEGYVADSVEAIAKVNVVVSLSTVAESFGRTMVEAMAARRPVVAYANGAIPELVRHGRDGFIVPPFDIARMLEYLEMLAGDRLLLTEIGRNGRRRAARLFSRRQFALQLNASIGGYWMREARAAAPLRRRA